MRVLSVDTSNDSVAVLEIQLEQNGHTNEVYVNREIKAHLKRKQLESRPRTELPQNDNGIKPVKSESLQSPITKERSIDLEQHHTPASQSSDQHKPHIMESPETQPTKITRFNSALISHLEKKYCGGLEPEEPTGKYVSEGEDDEEDHAIGNKKKGKQANDNYYDLDDPFIDDTDLLDVLEQQRRLSRTKTKHQGFFVSAGELEVQEQEASNQGERPSDTGAVRRKRTWEPSADALQAIELFRAEAESVLGGASSEKKQRIVPKALDTALRRLDKALGCTSNDTQIFYLDKLLEFLPLARNTLKSAILRLRLQERAQNAQDAFHQTYEELKTEVTRVLSSWTPTAPSSQPTSSAGSELSDNASQPTEASEPTPMSLVENGTINKSPADTTPPAEEPRSSGFPWEQQTLRLLAETVQRHEEWIEFENKYRQLLRPEEKKELSNAGGVELDQRREQDKLFAEIASLWPPHTMEVSELRRQYTVVSQSMKRKREEKEARRKSEPGPSGRSQENKESKRKLLDSAGARPEKQHKSSHMRETPLYKRETEIKPEKKPMPVKSVMFEVPPSFQESDFTIRGEQKRTLSLSQSPPKQTH